MNRYELALILRPGLEEDGQQAIIDRLTETLAAEGGQVTNVESWGRRQLAYPINKVSEGYYYFIQGQFATSVLPEVDRSIRLSEDVLRHMIVRTDK
jgi:small subunit ribosomal protein S6